MRFDLSSIFAPIFIGTLLSACNTTAPMYVEQVATLEPALINTPVQDQAMIALARTVVDIRRGSVIAHFPATGLNHLGGSLCNYRHANENATLEWGTGSTEFGNWRDEIGQIFFEVLNNGGYNVAGDPSDLFGQSEEVGRADFQVGARITSISGNICHAHHWFDGRPLFTYSADMALEVDWSVYSVLRKQEVFQATTKGSFTQTEPKKNGILLTFLNSFGHATENLMAVEGFAKIVTGETDKAQTVVSGPEIAIPSRTRFVEPLVTHLDSAVSGVVTIRIGRGHGSGFIISEDGLIITNQHVVGEAKSVTVVTYDGLEVQGEVLRQNTERDVALIKVPIRFPIALPIDLNLPDVLDDVYVIGTPTRTNLSSTATKGVVSAIRVYRSSVGGGKELPFIQADVAVSPGNSGGPMFDAFGNVIGITVLAIKENDADALNFFIPMKSGLEALNIRIADKASS